MPKQTYTIEIDEDQRKLITETLKTLSHTNEEILELYQMLEDLPSTPNTHKIIHGLCY